MKANHRQYWMRVLAVLTVFSLLLGGCDSLAATAEPTPAADLFEERSAIVSATGEALPARWAALSAAQAGLVIETLAAEGDVVEAGQVLARLDGQAEKEAALEAAHYEQVLAQQALDELNQGAAAAAVAARQEQSAARRALIVAQRELQPYTEDTYETDLDRLKQDVVDARDKLTEAEDDFEPYADFDEENSTRKSYKSRLDDAQQDYDEKLRKQEELELDKLQAEQAVDLAEARLVEANLQVEQTASGPDVDLLQAAEARLSNARLQVSAAEDAFADLELRAPFSGVLTRWNMRSGEWVTPGDVLGYLADLSALHVETTDMNEIDAARVTVGDAVSVTFDALPELVARGKVTRIALQAAEGSGVNYTVVIELNEIPEALRWGMTAFVDIEVGE